MTQHAACCQRRRRHCSAAHCAALRVHACTSQLLLLRWKKRPCHARGLMECECQVPEVPSLAPSASARSCWIPLAIKFAYLLLSDCAAPSLASSAKTPARALGAHQLRGPHAMQVQAASSRSRLGSRQARSAVTARPAAGRPARARLVAAAAAAAAPDKFIPPWRDCFNDLKAKGLRTVAPEEAVELLNSGSWVLLDVRRPDQHAEGHPEGAVNVPMYRLIDMSKPDLAKVMKVIAYSFNGVQAIESNTAFTSDVLAAAPGKKFVVLCEAGGTMRQTVNFPQGKPSRSLQAAYKLLNEGGVAADDVVHLERGVYGWYQASLPIKGSYTPDLGRTPMAAQDPMLQNVAQSTGYEQKEGDKAVEPAAKKNWFGF